MSPVHFPPLFLSLLTLGLVVPTAFSSPPSFLILILDDYGWNNWGIHASSQPNSAEIQTPNLDALARQGVILDRHYTFKFCSPSRSALHTGRNPIHVNSLNSDLSSVNLSDPVSGFAGIPRNMTAFPQKLQAAGWGTQQAGKWHLGLATPDHTPHGRGYNHSLSYLDGANDHWVQTTGDWCGSGQYTDLFGSRSPAFGLNSSWACSQKNQLPTCHYEDDLFTNFTVQRIQDHDPTQGPLMVYFAPHAVHMPLEIPQGWLDKFSNISTDSKPRQLYSAMTNYMDFHVGEVLEAWRAKGLWDTSFVFVSADNGGPIYGGGSGCRSCDGDAGANNYPLRGGKHSNFEGGVRVNAFVSGGLIPPSQRGTTLTHLTAMEDLYKTILGLAGVDAFDERGGAAGLPPVEGYDLWPLLSGANATPPRTEVWLGSTAPMNGVYGGGGVGVGATPPTFVQGIIDKDGWKVLHDVIDNAARQGPFYPNATTASHPWNNTAVDCGTMEAPTCLFNVFDDPTESNNVYLQHPDVVAALSARMKELQTTVFSPDRGSPSQLACKASQETWGGFVGPFLP